MADPFVVVGGDAAGLSAASKYARENPDGDVVVFEKGRWVSYAHCGTPYYVKGEVDNLTDLLSLSPEDAADRGIDLRREHEVVGVDTDAQTVAVVGDGERFEQPYSDLLVATGAHAVTDPIPGSDREMAFTMHGLDSAAAVRAALSPAGEEWVDTDIEYVDADLVQRYTDRDPPDRVAVVGGGYVGVEMAEAFRAHGLETHVFQRSSHLLPPFGDAVCERVADHLREQGVTLHLNTAVSELDGGDSVEAVVHEDGRVPVDLALVGIGIAPNTQLLSDTPVELGESDAVAVDDYGRTNIDGVYAAGDCAEARHAVTGESTWVPLGLTANRAGRAIGQTVAGDPEPVGDVAGTAVVKAFELECGRVGLVHEDAASDAGFDPVSVSIDAGSRSGYYPGGDETTVTLTADRDSGRVLGGSIVGRDRAAVRIDTLATALESDLTVAELERLDLAYAPPFSPVWDPILVAAKVLRGTLE
ncbi:FAD-dependent oxidoreductase [Halomicroarcula sp. S1AR25-4]|uniref:FAD-dependent oxidoreductase n=1 Tax=Haloarcula sp. S1AR25-4 TaxID=2950538 RepID=UPI0028769A97|nr:FAD-dependent oxidoreductase [Halomicroarcula sp. S1AR25-4]MDS0279984.1 FAD-dependent oxidoreductase [Halomicroarcula sp. S1AR25-4]